MLVGVLCQVSSQLQEQSMQYKMDLENEKEVQSTDAVQPAVQLLVAVWYLSFVDGGKGKENHHKFNPIT